MSGAGEAAAGATVPTSITIACRAGNTAAVAAWLDAGCKTRVDASWTNPEGTMLMRRDVADVRQR